MRKTYHERRPRRAFRCALAAVLACGLMIPAAGIAAFADAEESPTPPLAPKIEPAAEAAPPSSPAG